MRLIIFYLAATVLCLVSCNQEELSISTIASDTTLQALVLGNDETDGKEEANKGDKEQKEEVCFELNSPLSVTMPDGSLLSGQKEEVWEAVKAWYEAHPEEQAKPALNYPVDVFWLKDEISKTVENEEEMEMAKKYCAKGKDKEEKEDCFELSYPVTWTMADGTTIAMSDEKDWEAIKAWYEANPVEKEKPSLTYPVDIVLEDGTSQTINSEEEMVAVKKECK
ncbi:MAG: hypothetical protein AAF806_03520 [Bacteroidota bacterium]